MPKKRAPLDRTQVLEAALKLLDKEGLAKLSMRRLAATLKVEAMSLYNGDFLAGFSLKDSSAFEEWLLVKRE